MLSLTGKRWLLPDQDTPINASHVLARLLAERQIDPDTESTLIPSTVYKDMPRAVQRVTDAIQNKQTIGIFGDYDCDGVTAVAQLQRFFRRRDIDPWVRLPHRVHDGYGLSMELVQEVMDAKVDLLITADTGVASVKEITALKEAGIDVIVTDHHHVHEEIPPAFAIIHPHFSTHPLPHPSGSGVAFALVYALEGARWEGIEEDLSLSMFGTVADLVPLQGGNRTLTQLGLSALEQIPSGPIAELRERCRSKNARFTARDVAFRIAPRINAAGRLEDPDIALRALLEGGEDLQRLDSINDERQALTRSLFDTALDTIDTATPLLSSVSGQYPHGIIGLIAGKLTEQYGKPSMVAFTDGVECIASLRSPSCYNIVEGLHRVSSLLASYGGHAQAAGCRFAIKDVDDVIAALCDDVSQHVSEEELVPTLRIDSEIDAGDITLDFCAHLESIEPFGQGNREPLFLIRNAVLQDARPCGSDDSHLQATIAGIKAIGFGMAEHICDAPMDIVATVQIDTWNGRQRPQIVIEDLAATHVHKKQSLLQ